VAIQSLWLQDFRCFESLELFFSEGLNWIHGANGSGKTSVLEAVYWCGRARSFRTNQSKGLIAKEKDRAFIRLTVEQQNYLGSALSRKESNSFRYRGEAIKRTSELNLLLSVQFLGPQSHKLIEPEPDARRLWLDWSLFHVKQSYLETYQRLKRGLSQRNQALRQKQSLAVITAFDHLVAQLAVQLEADRQLFVTELKAQVKELQKAFSLDFNFTIDYKQAIPATASDYQKLLEQFVEQDKHRGFTWHTAFRSKLNIETKGQNAALVLSRGQQKLAAFILLLAQQKLLLKHASRANVLLVDDLHAELDSRNRLLLSDYLQESGQQVLVTSTEEPDSAMKIKTLFHVEQGRLSS
jgi:DNA replication and repair protein RecF